jgi:hypothetical protein
MSIDRCLTRLALDRRLFRPVAEVAAAPVPLKTAADVLAVLAEQAWRRPAFLAPSPPSRCGPSRPATWRYASNCWRRC